MANNRCIFAIIICFFPIAAIPAKTTVQTPIGARQHRHQANEIELTKIRINSSPTMEYWVSFTQ
ncbi:MULTISPECIES: hypothetical protein, partial [Bacillus]